MKKSTNYIILVIVLGALLFVAQATNVCATNWSYTTMNSARFNDEVAIPNGWTFGNYSMYFSEGIEIVSYTETSDGVVLVLGIDPALLPDLPAYLKVDASNDPITGELVLGAGLLVDGTVTFNDAGGDFDLQIKGDSEANLLYIDASTDRVGIGTATPAEILDVIGNILASGTITTGAVTYPNTDGAEGYVLTSHNDGSPTFAVVPSGTLDAAYDAGDTIDYSSGNGPVVFNFPDGGATYTITDATGSTDYNVRNQLIQVNEADSTNVSTLYYTETDDVTPGDYHLMGFLSTDSGTNKYLRWFVNSQGTFQGIGYSVRNYPTNADPIHVINQDQVTFNLQGSDIDFAVESDNIDNAIKVDAGDDTVTFGVPATYIGDYNTAGSLYFCNGGGETFRTYYPDLNPGIDAGLTWPTNAPAVDDVLTVDSVTENLATTKWEPAAGGNGGGGVLSYQFALGTEELSTNSFMSIGDVDAYTLPVLVSGAITTIRIYIGTWTENEGKGALDVYVNYGVPGSYGQEIVTVSGAGFTSVTGLSLAVTAGSHAIEVQLVGMDMDTNDALANIGVTILVESV